MGVQGFKKWLDGVVATVKKLASDMWWCRFSAGDRRLEEDIKEVQAQLSINKRIRSRLYSILDELIQAEVKMIEMEEKIAAKWEGAFNEHKHKVKMC